MRTLTHTHTMMSSARRSSAFCTQKQAGRQAGTHRQTDWQKHQLLAHGALAGFSCACAMVALEDLVRSWCAQGFPFEPVCLAHLQVLIFALSSLCRACERRKKVSRYPCLDLAYSRGASIEQRETDGQADMHKHTNTHTHVQTHMHRKIHLLSRFVFFSRVCGFL